MHNEPLLITAGELSHRFTYQACVIVGRHFTRDDLTGQFNSKPGRRFADLLGQCDIKEFVGTDYAFRIFVDKPVWSQVLVGLNEDMDYDNFKSEVARFQGSDGAAYEHSLHDVWSVMNRLQK